MNVSNATVYIVDDDAGMRDSLALLLSLRGFSTQMFANAADLLRAYQQDWRGCMLVDVRMPGMGGLELLQELRDRGCTVPVVIITAHGDVATARAALKARAADFLEKPIEDEVLIDVLQDAIAASAPGQAPAATRPGQQGGFTQVLTAREQQVHELVTGGYQVKQIAVRLGISPRTVEVYKSRVMQKLRI
jgi:FixJ family two-component response regulator